MNNLERCLKRLEDPEVQRKVKESFDVSITDVEFIRVRPAAQKDELAVTIASKSGKKVHLLVKGHYA